MYKFKKSVGRNDFSDQFKKIIIRYKRIGYNMNVMTRRQVLRYKSVTPKYVGHENAGYIKFSVFA